MKIVLANADYARHTTDEGEQLQRGFAHAGWKLAGPGFEIDEVDVREIVHRYKPVAVFVQDKRDWDPASTISYRKDVGFRNLNYLAYAPKQFRPYCVAVLKDAATRTSYQRAYIEDEVAADAVLVYYDPERVRTHCPWIDADGRQVVRIYHTVDAELIRHMVSFEHERRNCIVTGARSSMHYPLRQFARAAASSLGIDDLRHPGYGNKGAKTPDYLETLSRYKVHVATASKYGFALRKIIESVAVATTPVTNLQASDALPEIDGALVRVKAQCNVTEFREVLAGALRGWNLAERMEWARKALAFYDWRAAGLRVDADVMAKVVARK